MRFYIIFGITFLLLGIIIFYNPYSEYLGVYKDSVNIEYNFNDEDYFWIYEIDNDNLNIKQIDTNKWSLSINKDGITNVIFYYFNDKTNDTKYKINYEFKIKNNKIYWTQGEGKGLLDFPNPY
ncbi:MAG: hypothetical protein ACI33S_03840 [Bacilli bacterium]